MIAIGALLYGIHLVYLEVLVSQLHLGKNPPDWVYAVGGLFWFSGLGLMGVGVARLLWRWLP